MGDFNPIRLADKLGKEWELMWSTGLKDKNHVEIWEGDYLSKEECYHFVVELVIEYGCLMAVSADPIRKVNFNPVMVKKLLDDGYVKSGNIYENPELLEETK